MPRKSSYLQIYAVVGRIPRGRVATYGQVANLAELAGQARLVGYALSALPESSALPWHRVINARGQISERSTGLGRESLQRVLLRKEKIHFDGKGIIPLSRFRWRPGESES